MKNILYGEPVSRGRALGKARLIRRRQDIKSVKKGDIIVSHRINPELALSMIDAGGIVTERGSLVCHAASIAREFNIPAVIRVANARDCINNGDIIEVDADKGRVKILFRRESLHNTLYLTDKCNNNCIICPLERDKDFSLHRLSVKEIKKRIDAIPKKTSHINISGGEPTILKDDFFKILEHCREALPSTRISILTNARMFYYKVFASKLRRICPKNIEIVAALHSFDEKTHNLIAGSEGFKQTIRGIKNMLDLGLEVEIRVVINKFNYKQLPQISEFISQNFQSADRVCFLYMELTGRARENLEKSYIPYQKIMPYLERAGDILEKCHIHFRLYHFPLCVLKRKMWNFVWDSITEYKKAEMKTCRECIMKGNCCRVFQSYTDIIGEGEFKSIKYLPEGLQ